MRMRVVNAAPYTQQHWETTSKVAELEICYRAFGKQLTPRQERLLFCGLARNYFTQFRSKLFWEAITIGERWADDGQPPFGVDDLRRKIGRRREPPSLIEWVSNLIHRVLLDDGEGRTPSLEAWAWLADECIAQVPYVELATRVLECSGLVEIFRDFVPNPFLRLEWNPDWFTSTVRELATVMYEHREFSAMPILADALQDAGCDNEQILNHCRAEKLHARGCWVLDAILGKT